MLLGDFLNRLQKAKPIGKGEYQAKCPAHTDKNPSLHIRESEGKLLIDCKAGCSAEQIVEAMGLTLSDLFLKTEALPVLGEIECAYDYTDEDGKLLFQVVRYKPKAFRQRHKNSNGEWVWNLDGIRRVLYHLQDILLCTETIYFVEGEKDADNLIKWGLIATNSPGGANAWRDEYATFLAGKRVVLMPHKDNAGLSYGRHVANSLADKAAEIKVVLLPGDNIKDVSDWLDAGGDVGQLPALEQDIEVLYASDKPVYRRQNDESIRWDKKIGSLLLSFRAEKIGEERTGIHARISIFGQREMLSWSYLNIERREDRSSLAGAAHKALTTEENYKADDLRHDTDSFCAGLWDFRLSQFEPAEVSGEENPAPLEFYLKPYIQGNGGTLMFSPPGRGKSYTALLWAVSIDAGCNKLWPVTQKKVLFINLERSANSVRRRLSLVNKVLGLPAQRQLLMLNARGKPLAEVLPVCRKSIAQHRIEVVVLDSISRAGLGDLNENIPGNRIIDSLSALCPTWLALGHTSRKSDEHVYGTIMLDAGADICIQLSSEIKDDGTLGVGYQITKQNDIGYYRQQIYAFEFNGTGLTAFRSAKPYEFPKIEDKAPVDPLTAIIEYIQNQDSGDATATEVANEFGFDRANVSRLLSKSGKFIVTRKEKTSVYYGVTA